MIVDNKSNRDVELIVMADDGKGESVNIPTFLISMFDGVTFKDVIQKSHYSNDTNDHIKRWKNTLIAEADLSLMEKTDKPLNVDLWYAGADELYQSGIKMDHYARMSDMFGDKVKFQPRTMSDTCFFCTKEVKKRCILDGKYCPNLSRKNM